MPRPKGERHPYRGDDPLFKLLDHIPHVWVRDWPHPIIPDGQRFVGHHTRLAEVRAALEAAGYKIKKSKPGGSVLDHAQTDEVEVQWPPG